jgi:hypothetical protein
MFAVLRIVEVSLAVLGLLTSLLVFTAPSSPGSTTRALYFIAWSTPGVFVSTAAALFAVAGLLEIISRPLKRKWSHDLRGWIE